MPKKPSKTLQTKQTELDKLVDTLQASVEQMQKILSLAVTNNDIGLSAFARVSKMIADILDRVYKIKFGKAAQEEMMLKIGELQRHIMRVEEHNAERERRSRSKPLIDVIGELINEEAIIPDADDGKPEDLHPVWGARQIEAEVDLQRTVDEGLDED